MPLRENNYAPLATSAVDENNAISNQFLKWNCWKTGTIKVSIILKKYVYFSLRFTFSGVVLYVIFLLKLNSSSGADRVPFR